jgi:hypothetical protein
MSRKSGTNTDGRNADGTFAPGNPGKPKGSRHRATQAALTLLDGEAEALTRKAVDLALGGDTTALRLALERIVPLRREGPVNLALPRMHSAADAAAAMAAVVGAVAHGDLTPGEGAAVAALIEIYRKTMETAELEARVEALEANHGKAR